MPSSAFSDKTKQSLFKMSYTLIPINGNMSMFGMFLDAKIIFLSTTSPSIKRAELIFKLESFDLNKLVLALEILNSFNIFSFPSLSFFRNCHP